MTSLFPLPVSQSFLFFCPPNPPLHASSLLSAPTVLENVASKAIKVLLWPSKDDENVILTGSDDGKIRYNHYFLKRLAPHLFSASDCLTCALPQTPPLLLLRALPRAKFAVLSSAGRSSQSQTVRAQSHFGTSKGINNYN